jgi:hypothetical protein
MLPVLQGAQSIQKRKYCVSSFHPIKLQRQRSYSYYTERETEAERHLGGLQSHKGCLTNFTVFLLFCAECRV